MIDHDYFELFQQDSIDKQLVIECEDGTTITNEDIFSESMTITESLCSEDSLKFGSCEASSFKIQVANIMSSLIGQWLTVSIKLNGSDVKFPIGKYKVNSDKPTADRAWRNLVAYDAMYDILNTDVSDWYNELLPNTDKTVSLKTFRDSFCSYFGITQESTTLTNDSMTIEKTISPSELGSLSGKDVITAICEINGVFGHITRNGTLEYIEITQGIKGLYPRNDLYPSNTLYPREEVTTPMAKNGEYISADYEDFECQSITKLQVRQEENDIGVTVGGGDNAYIIEDNFLVYGKSTDDLKVIANRTLSKIIERVYRPFTAEVKGNFCFEVGDPVRLYTKYELIESYILNRTISGIQGLRDSFEAKGEEVCSGNVNSVKSSIIQLKGKTNTLTRTIEETNSTIVDVEEGLSSRITQNANSIESEVTRAKGQEETLSSRITQTESSIETEVNDRKGETEDLSSRITQTATDISLEVTRATGAEGNLSSRISQSAHTIELSVDNSSGTSAGITISLLDENGNKLKDADGTITLTGLVSFESLKTSGKTVINGANITTGSISCDRLNGGTISGQTISGGTITGSTINATGTFTSESGVFKATLDSAALNFYRSGTAYASFRATQWATKAGYYGTAVNSEPDSKFISFGNKNSSSDSAYASPLILNYGLDPDGYTEDVIITGTSRITGGAKISGGVNIGGDTTMQYTKVEYDLTVDGDLYAGSLDLSGNNIYSDTTVSLENSGGQVIFYTKSGDVAFRPEGSYTGKIMLGSSLGYWSAVYAKNGTIQTSDRNKKHDIKDISEKYEELFFKLKPVTYGFNNGDRTHIGAISQDVEESMNEVGLSDIEFAGFCKDVRVKDVKDEDGNITEEKVLDDDGNEQYDYSLRYSEFIMLNTHMIQKAYKKIEEQQAEIDTLKEQVSFLLKKLGGNAE